MWSDCPSCRMFGGKQFRRKNYELLVEHLNTHVLDIVIVTWLLVLRSFGTHLPVGLTIRKLPSLFRLFSRLLHESPLRECFSLRRVEDFFRALVRTCVRFFGFRCVFRFTARRVFRPFRGRAANLALRSIHSIWRNLTGLVLGCIEAKFCKKICVWKLSPRSTQCTPLHRSKITFFSKNC